MRRAVDLLLLGLPAAFIAKRLGAPETVILASSGLSLVPLSLWIARATDHLARHAGSSIGGLLNATFANAAELIVGVLALRRGLIGLVKASIIGSIIGNMLLALGLSAFVGGVRHGPQKFPVKPAGRHAAMMILAMCAMALPAAFGMQGRVTAFQSEEVSVAVAAVLLGTYGAYVFYSYFSPRARRAGERLDAPHSERTHWPLARSFGTLAAAVAGTTLAAELMVAAVDPVSRDLKLTPAFIGLILVPLIGNLAEYTAAVGFAAENRIELSMSIAATSSTQVAVFVAPVLVLASVFFQPMNFVFRSLELVALFGSCAIFAYISLDGETNWLEGVQLVALYLIAAVAFFFLPA